jgi:5-methyltetrahydrofolate--homocysteine methyltransferase
MKLQLPVLLDGATGTALQAQGYDGSVCTEQWTLEHPAILQKIQRDYLRAGSRVLYTPTFGANRVKLEEHGLFGKVEEYNRRLTALTREVAGEAAYVAGDIAPTGLFLAPMGETTFEELVEIYTEQAAALERAGVDLFVIETMMTLPEARAAVLAVKSVSRRPVIVSFTCDQNGKTLSGTDVTAALLVLQGMGVDAFGLNCSAGPREMLPQLRRLREYAGVPLLAKPNAGLPRQVDGQMVYSCPPEEFASFAASFAEAGVALFGGCCGTTEGHIAALREKLGRFAPPAPQHEELLPCATEKQPFLLAADVKAQAALRCTEELPDELEALPQGALVKIFVTSPDDLEVLADCQYAIANPLCFSCEDAALLEQALRIYQGRALYEGGLPERALLPLAHRYGLIL